MPKLHIFKPFQRETAPPGPDRYLLNRIARRGGLVLALFLLLSACAPKPLPRPSVPPSPPVLPAPAAPVAPAAEIDTGEKLFTNAEKRFEEKSYPPALENYHEYLKRFPAGPFAEKTWSRLGEIYMRLNDFQKSRNAYTRLFTDYPDSPFAAEARIEWLATYYNQGQYDSIYDYERSATKYDIAHGYLWWGDSPHHIKVEAYWWRYASHLHVNHSYYTEPDWVKS